ncbi:MAG TPA: serine protease [Chthoniobacteraceae bacterium]|nr:serine protease [Chthoniobacteraceae bacterium]
MKGSTCFFLGVLCVAGIYGYFNGLPEEVRQALNRFVPASVTAPVEGAVAHITGGGEYGKDLLIADGSKGEGSGCLIDYQGHTLIVTNAHIISEIGGAKFRELDSTEVPPASAFAFADGADLAVAAQTTAAHGLELANVDKEVAVGDDVIVLGNSLGADVATKITGKVTGIGPNLVEVDAKFVEGNSGSPIIQVKSGKVIGIATFAERPRVTALSGDSQYSSEWRRFGYRLDTVRLWQHPSPQQFAVESETYESVHKKTLSLIALAEDLSNGHIVLAKYEAPDNPLRQIVTDYLESASGLNKTSLVPGDARMQFVHGIVFEIDSDTRVLRQQDFTWFHWHMLQMEFETRKELKKAFQRVESAEQTRESMLH